ncbi:MAG: lysoplasmalogenase [Microbacterium sp.]
MSTVSSHAAARFMPHQAWGFFVYSTIGILHVVAISLRCEALEHSTKLLLMPVLAIAVWTASAGARRTWPFVLLVAAFVFSWFGDAPATLLPFLPETPGMLAGFALTHVCFLVLFIGAIGTGRPKPWALVYLLWWVVLLVVLLPSFGALLPAVAVYGLLLGGMATAATRCHPLVIAGSVLFVISDTVLAFRLFRPEIMPFWTSLAVMVTYIAGQGLIAAGTVTVLLARPRPAAS